MANDCLVKELKKEVSNNNLVFLGMVKLTLAEISGVSSYIRIMNTKSFSAKIIGTGHLCSSGGEDYGQEHLYSSSADLYVKDTANGDILLLGEKYSLAKITLSGSPIIKDNSILDFGCCALLDTISFGAYAHPIYNIEDVAKDSRNLSSIINTKPTDNSNLTGSIEKAVEYIFHSNRNFETYPTLSLKVYNSNITLNGNLFFKAYADRAETMTITFTSNSVTCTWKGNAVATYDGTNWTYSS